MRFFSTQFNVTLANAWLLIFRVAVGGFMLTHGYPKLLRLTAGGEIPFADPFGLGAYPSFVLVVFAEFVCSILLIVGLGTRFAAFAVAIAMAVAAFMAHAADPFAKKELPLLYLVCVITILVFGAGKYSFDQLIVRKKKAGRR